MTHLLVMDGKSPPAVTRYAAASSGADEGCDSKAFEDQLIATIPHLRAFARSLCHDVTQADDLTQEALVKAWKARASFQAGTSIKAWTFMILRNHYYSEKRRSWRTVPLDMESAENMLLAVENPSAPIELLELRGALASLPEDQREALMLVGAGGMAYEEVARIYQCAVGTIKSRVSRARRALEALLCEGGSCPRHSHDIRADRAFEDLLGQVAALSGRPSG